MIIYGGTSGSSPYLNDTWTFSLASGAWTQLFPAQSPASGRISMGSAFDPIGGRMFVVGGWGPGNLSDTYALTLDGTPTWTPLSTAAGFPGNPGLSAIWDPVGNRLIAFGGDSFTTDAWALDMSATAVWQQLGIPGGPGPRSEAAAVYDPVSAAMVLFGGSSSLQNDTWMLSLSGTPEWRQFLGQIPTLLNYGSVFDPVGRQILLFGGSLGSSVFSASLDDQPVNWSQVALSTAPSARRSPACVWDPVRDRMVIFGGRTPTGGFPNDVWTYSSRPTPTWTQLTTSGVLPNGRESGGAVYDAPRDRLVLFGGSCDFLTPTVQNDTWELPFSGPNALRWRLLSPPGLVPSRRMGFAMGSDPERQRAIVVGGWTGNTTGLTNDVWALDLSVDPPVWAPVFPLGGFPALQWTTAIVEPVSDRLIFFGGSGTTLNGDAFALSLVGPPVWTRLAPGGPAPTPRYGMAAVFDPVSLSMTFVGGYGSGGATNDTWSLKWDLATAARASLAESHAEPGLVRITWAVVDAGNATFAVERQQGGSGWTSLGAPSREGADRLTLEDRAIPEPGGYEYRLLSTENGAQTVLSSVSIEVPSGFRLALAGARPNPSPEGAMRVAFSLERKGPARLDLLDVAGRRVASRDLSTLDAGQHVMTVGGDAPLTPGLYLLKLTAGDRSLTAKAFVVR